MVTVALVGASSGLGAVILDAILATKAHTVIVLSRTPNPSITAKGATVHPVDYTDHRSLTTALHGVHTLLCTLGGIGPIEMQDYQLALIAAAKEAGVKRFAPSEFATSSYDNVDLFAGKHVAWAAAKASGMECTRFTCGIFMNAFGTGTPKGEVEALGGLRPWTFIVDMLAGTADLPGDGGAKVTFTRTADIGKFVAGALELETWEEEMGMVGETVSYNEVVGKIERVQGRKMLVRGNGEGELRKMIEEEPEKRFYNQIRLIIAEGKATVPPTLNKLVPGVKPWSMDEYLERYWGAVEVGEAGWKEGNILL